MKKNCMKLFTDLIDLLGKCITKKRMKLQVHYPWSSRTAGHIVFVYSRLFAGGGMNTRLPVYVSKKLGYLDFDHSSITELRHMRHLVIR